MIKLLNLEVKINQIIKKIEMYSIEVADYLHGYNHNLDEREAICLLVEIPDILQDLNELLRIYVESVEEEYAKLPR